MKRKMSLVIITLFTISVGIFLYYRSHYTNTAILKNSTSRKGYSLNISKEAVDIELFIKPEWIPFDSNKRKNLNLKLNERNNSNIILAQVWNRGNDIYFSFDTSYSLDYYKGEFLYNGIFNQDGTFSWNSNLDALSVYESLNHPIKIGQTGLGPNSAFSFGIEPEQYDRIRGGFYVKYSGMTLYRYSLNK
jgi:hypothetical protein